jgi:PPOX class probable F420-dependent enzyme
MANRIEGRARELLEAPNFANVGTINRDGSPRVVPVWMDVDGDTVRLNTSRGRGWLRNLERDPRIAVTVEDRENPYEYVTIRGRAELSEDGAEEHIHRLAQKYLGQERYPWLQPGEVRVIVRVVPERIAHMSG